MNIFIAGCGRSGTTLARDLMKCFRDTFVLVEGPYGEAHYTRFATLDRPESNRVIKRLGESWETLEALPEQIGLIYCVRHPFDTLTSTHPLSKHDRRFHITRERWTAEYRALATLRAAQPHRRIFYLRYEDLISEPDPMQDRLGEHFGLTIHHRFTENPDGIEIFSRSVGKWHTRPEFRRYFQTFPHSFRLLHAEFCREFGYTLPADYTQWRRFLLDTLTVAVVRPKFPTLAGED